MHYERAPCFRRLKLMVRRRLRSAAQGLAPTAAAREGTADGFRLGIHRDSDKSRKILGTMALYLEGKTPLTRVIFPPRRQLK